MSRIPAHWAIAWSMATGTAFLAGTPAAAGERPADVGGLGMALEGAATDLPSGLRSPSSEAPCYLLVPAGRSDLEDPARLEALLSAAGEAGLRVVVRLTDEGWGEPGTPRDDWFGRVGDLARRAGGRAAAYQILDAPAGRHAARAYAFLIKSAAVAIRSARSGARVVSGAIREGDAGWVRELYSFDAAPYIDVLSASGSSAFPTVAGLRDDLDPGAALWLTDAGVEPASPQASAARVYLEASAAGAEVVLFGEGAGGIGESLSWLRAFFPPGLAGAAAAALPFDPGPVRALPFFDAARQEGIVAYRSAAPGRGEPALFRLKIPLEALRLLDPRTLADAPIAGNAPAGAVVSVPLVDDYLLLRYRVPAAAVPLRESLHVGAVAELSAEEIIAREREFGAAQAARLKHYEARATVAIHYRIASLSQSVDVATESRLFVHDGKQDYEQTDLFVNGARWRGKSPPYLPFLQPEKVKDVPLEIALDEGYRYALEGREKVDGRDCYVVSFEPTVADRSLYRGRVFIDSGIFARVRMQAVQTALKDPLRSNEVDYLFAPVASEAGEFWLPTAVSGQMVFEVLGQNLVVERRASYDGFAINRDEFSDRLAESYSSGRPLYRETDEGYYRLDATGGAQVLTSASTPRNVFLVMGASIGFGGDPGLPFAGVNFFDFDYRGTGTQVDIAWAGPFADLSWTNPRVARAGEGRRPWALTVRGSFNALARRDKNRTAAGTDSSHNVDLLRESVTASLAIPMGHFAKWTLEARAAYMKALARDETDAAFALPPSTLEPGLLLRLEHNRSGYIAALWGEAARRRDWDAWGFPGTTPFNERQNDYTRLGMELKKAFYIGPFRKLSLGLAGYEGRGLDRFSRFELGDFRAARVRGFNGSGIHFDRGLVADATYSFTVGRAFRLNFGVEEGWVQNLEEFGPGYERLIGGGIDLQFSGPWSTLALIRVIRGFSSTLDGGGRGGDLRLVFFRTFDRWSRRPRP
jgi:hypothetical protein